ncbi:glycerophosphoryl diester phosphodiesterase family protein [Talaromyces stipitatus ATCC 10500]|uniref:Glycerophosphoryl diester phosphodiesterase family protein n=1 Tax=Talaromyces stipitatus (strain ATCC 10500 / CBS 375.48 / QM 6759 / NRRL 1006) TaxID=441959 RepID=B8M5F8_TALSN|nr:glycerophosphoryl diester phosphodiesterase family protein [Talaromyces stipitatus ATCC 10500]EED19764.1 glycerophosphoryl diester phosphodiesterase family protein [Talaromyces stipitatus ATCC 10500]
MSSSTESTKTTFAQKAFFRQPFYAKDGKTRLPHYVAHRGFNRVYPENTLSAFQAAIDVGCQGIETDVQISKDGVVVISHDATLNRCFGIDKKINECDWEYLSTLRTIREPREKMLRLSDLLEFISAEGRDHIWVLLDIKRNNPANVILPKIAETLKSGPYSSQPWNLRIVLGCWTPTYFPICKEYLPAFQPAVIGFNIVAARKVLRTLPEVLFNIHFKSVKGPLGYDFIDAVHKHRDPDSDNNEPRLIFGWTINAPRDIRWAIRHGFDAVLTDDPATCKQISDVWDDAYSQKYEREDNKVTVGERVYLTLWGLWFVFFGWVFPLLYPYLQRFLVERPAVKSNIRGSSERT